jgi:chromosome segregation ATPase
MTEQELQPGHDAEKRALNELISRFSADRDGLTTAVERCQTRLEELSERLTALSSRPASSDPLATSHVDAWRAEAERALALAERNAEALAALQHRIAETGQEAAVTAIRTELAQGLERVGAQIDAAQARTDEKAHELRTTLEALERRVEGALAPDNVDPDETPWATDVTKVRAEIIELRESGQRAVAEAQARLGVRVESIVAGVEAQVSRIQDDLWQRLGDLQARLEVQVKAVGGLRDDVHAAQRGVEELEIAVAEQSRRGARALVERACSEVAAAVLGVASVGVIIGRYAAGAVRPRSAG